MHSPSLACCYREDISLHVLLVLVLSFRTECCARGDDKKEGGDASQESRGFSDVNHALWESKRDIPALLKYNGADKSTRREEEEEEVRLYWTPAPRTPHFPLIISFPSPFRFFNRKIKRFQMYVRIVWNLQNSWNHYQWNISPGWKHIKKRMEGREDYGKRYLCGTLWPVSSSTCIADLKIPSTSRPLKTEESCNATIPPLFMCTWCPGSFRGM